MKATIITSALTVLSFSTMAQNFIYSSDQHIVAEVQNENYEAYNIDINTPTPQAIEYKWERISNTFPAAWTYNLCDYNSCALGVPANGTMEPISLVESENGIIGYLHLNLTVGQNFGQGKVEIYVYEASNYTNGDTVSWDITWTNTTGINSLEALDAKIFPNPATDFVKIELDENESITSVKIIGLDRKEYSTQNETESLMTIDLSELPDGMYFVEINSENGTRKRSKLIKSGVN